MQPLAEKLAEAYSAAHPNVQIDIQGGGSGVGVKSAGDGTVDIGNVSRKVKDEELQQYPDLKPVQIAIDGVAVVVNPSVTVSGLTAAQVKDIFTGKVTNWKEVGGADKAIVVVAREEGSGTRDFFQEHFFGKDKEAQILAEAILQSSNGAVRTTVATTPDSIGFLSFGYIDQSVKALAIDGVEATEANVYNGTYGATRPFVMATKGDPTGEVKAFLDWILGPEGQEVVKKAGYFALKG